MHVIVAEELKAAAQMRRYRNYSRYIYIHKVILHTINT